MCVYVYIYMYILGNIAANVQDDLFSTKDFLM